jgi:peptidoglycan/LPS O-acetylase OafA/YrhL
MYFVVAASSVWFYRSQLTRNWRSFVLGGVLPSLGGGLMLVLCVYGLTTEAGVVTGVALGIIALVYVAAFVITRTAKSSPFLEELQRRRAAGLSGPAEEFDRAADAPEVENA